MLEDACVPRPELAVRETGAAMTGAGTIMALGSAPRPSAAALAGFLVPPTVFGHPFWKETGARAAQKIRVVKNLAMLGGLLLVMADN